MVFIDQLPPFEAGSKEKIASKQNGDEQPNFEAPQFILFQSVFREYDAAAAREQANAGQNWDFQYVFRVWASEALSDVDEICRDKYCEERRLGEDQEDDSNFAAVGRSPLPLHFESMDGDQVTCCHKLLYSNCQSGSCGCFRSHNGRALRTTGSFSKLYSGGGEVVAHSRVHPSQGSSPAGSPDLAERIIFHTKQRMPPAWKRTPMDEIRFQVSQPRPAG